MIKHKAEPKIDPRDSSLILDKMKSLIPFYVPEWNIQQSNLDDFGLVLCKIYSTLTENTINKLNKIPNRNFIEYLNVLGIKLTPKQAATVLVVMRLSEGVTRNVMVPKRTRIVASSDTSDDEITFSTESDFLVTFAKIAKIYEIYKNDPGFDVRIYDHTKTCTSQPNENPVTPTEIKNNIHHDLQNHILYVGDDYLFNLQKDTKISLMFIPESEDNSVYDRKKLSSVLANPDLVSWEYNWKVDPETGIEIPESAVPLKFYSRLDGSVHLTIKENVNISSVNGISSRWIRCRLQSIYMQDQKNVSSESYSSVNPFDVPRVSSISIKIPNEKEDFFKPELIFLNDSDLSKQEFVYPFGKNALPLSILYISSDQCFSKKGYKISIKLYQNIQDLEHSSDNLSSAKNTVQDQYHQLDILWEYWDGTSWSSLNSSLERTKPSTWQLDFKCPDDLSMTTVNGHEKLWIRGRTISSYTDYGVKVVNSDKESKIEYELPNLPPVELYVSYTPTSNVGKLPQYCLTYNNLEYVNYTANNYHDSKSKHYTTPFKPFEIFDDSPSILIGFDKKITGGPIHLYFSINDDDDDNNDTRNTSVIAKFHYPSNEKTWNRLDVVDSTNGLTKSGIVKIVFPPDFLSVTLFGQRMHWLKITNIKNNIGGTLLKSTNSVFLNAIEAINADYKTEILGSSDYAPNQTFNLKQLPILDKPVRLLVKYPKETAKTTTQQQTDSNVQDGNQNWVEWTEVYDISNSESHDKHFALDRALGKIQFGDGIHGMIPPLGIDNLKIEYYFGGGEKGNILPNKIESIKGSFPFVQSVFNPFDAGGGIEIETIDNAIKRGPQIIRHRGQAVTESDFEWIIKEYFPSIKKVKCFGNTDYRGKRSPGHITIVVLESSVSNTPIPSANLLIKIKEFLKARSNIVIANRLHVVSPKYAHISVNADLFPKHIESSAVLEKIVSDKLGEFFNPFRGGLDKSGWKFGEITSVSDVYKILSDIPEMENTSNVSLNVSVVDGYGSKILSRFVLSSDGDLNKIVNDPRLIVCNGHHHNLTIKWRNDIK